MSEPTYAPGRRPSSPDEPGEPREAQGPAATGGPWSAADDTGRSLSSKGEQAGASGTLSEGRQPASAPALPANLPARFGDYELLQEVARGAMGVVYKARQVSLNRIVALKMILQGELVCEEMVRRFYREAQAAAALDHPNIVPVYQVGQLDGQHFLSMAYIDGPTLKEAVQRGGLPSPTQAIDWLRAIAEGVELAHQHGILHRDLKPENVLIDPKGRPRVTDFGLAKEIEGNYVHTLHGQVIGTPAYIPPEQALGETEKIGPASDVYCLGGILYFLLTGQPPFWGRTVTEVLCRVVQEAPVPPRQRNPQAPPELEAICLTCLEKDPARRYPTAMALVEALRELGGRIEAGPYASPSATLTTGQRPGEVPSRAPGA